MTQEKQLTKEEKEKRDREKFNPDPEGVIDEGTTREVRRMP